MRAPTASRSSGLPIERVHLGQDRLFVALGFRIDAHEPDQRAGRAGGPRGARRRRGRRPPPTRSAASRASTARAAASPWAMVDRGGGEIGGRRRAERGLDQNVLRSERLLLPVGVLAHQNRQHLIRDGQRRIELLARLQREAHVGDDQNVRAHGARHVDGQVLRESAVDQQAPVIIDRSEHARRGDAGAHRDRQVAAVEQHRLAVLQVRRHRAKRRRQLDRNSWCC